MDMDSNSAATMRGRCRVCLVCDVEVVALSLTVCVFAEEVTLSQMLNTCCAIEISASDLKPQTLCNHCAKTAEQSFIFRKTCQKAETTLQEELDGINIKVEPDTLIIKEDHECEHDIKIESDELIIKEEFEEDDHKNGIMAVIKDEFTDCVSISNTSSTEKNMCQICQTNFTDSICLEHHLENCYRSVYGNCGQTITSDDTLNEHIITHEAPSTDRNEKSKCHKCRFCKMSYKYPAELRNHLMTHSQQNQKHINNKTDNKASDSLKTQSRFGCSVCKKSYRCQKYLLDHLCTINTSKKPHRCSHCSKEFDFSSDLTKHARTHTGEKPYECSQCDKHFTLLSNLKRHKLTHSGERPYGCPHCSKRFADQSNLNSHKLTHTGEKPYECSNCSKSFISNRELTIHERTHTGEKPYECSYCNRRFTQQCTLTLHKRTHTGEKPYQCSYCSKWFASKSNLKMHKRIHTGEKALYQH